MTFRQTLLARPFGLLPDHGHVTAEGLRQPGQGRRGHQQVVVGDPRTGERQAQTPARGEAEPGELRGEGRSVDAPAAGQRGAGQGAQAPMRWEDYTQTAMDPSDDCTIWYVGDYITKDAASYSSRIGAFRIPGCT